MSVVLPAPFAPNNAWISPRRTSKSTRSRATVPGNVFVIPDAATKTSPGASCSVMPQMRNQPPKFREELVHAPPLADPAAGRLLALRLLPRSPEDRVGVGERDDHDADLVRHDDIPGRDDHTTAVDGHVYLDGFAPARKRRVGGARAHGAAVQGEPEIPCLVDIPHSSID